MRATVCIMLSLFIASCTSLPKRTLKDVAVLKKTEAAETVVQKRLDNKSKGYVDGALRALELERAKTKKVSPEVSLALRLLNDATEIMGPPAPTEKLDIPALASDTPDVKALQKLEELEAKHKQELIERDKLLDKIEKLQQSITEQAEALATIQRRSLLQRIKDNIIEYLIIFGSVIALIIFGPMLIRKVMKNERT